MGEVLRRILQPANFKYRESINEFKNILVHTNVRNDHTLGSPCRHRLLFLSGKGLYVLDIPDGPGFLPYIGSAPCHANVKRARCLPGNNCLKDVYLRVHLVGTMPKGSFLNQTLTVMIKIFKMRPSLQGNKADGVALLASYYCR